MKSITLLSVAVLALLSTNAEARHRHATGLHPMCNILWPCIAPYASSPRAARATSGRYVSNRMVVSSHVVHRHVRAPKGHRMASRTKVSRGIAHSIAGIVAPLAAKVSEIKSACGSHVISGVRHTYVAGTRRISLHASGRAVDLSGNPSCIYSMLHGWPGGVSTDYARVRHVHLSYDPVGHREWGLRFVHGGHRHRTTRYAHHRHRHHRYALR